MRALRLAAAKPLPSLLLRRSFAPALAQRAATSVAAPDTSGRTPERTAELERLAAEHNGFLFGEVPLAEGQSREWEDWEYSYVPMMASAFVLYGLAYAYRPHKNLSEWAHNEAVSRMESGEDEDEE